MAYLAWADDGRLWGAARSERRALRTDLVARTPGPAASATGALAFSIVCALGKLPPPTWPELPSFVGWPEGAGANPVLGPSTPWGARSCIAMRDGRLLVVADVPHRGSGADFCLAVVDDDGRVGTAYLKPTPSVAYDRARDRILAVQGTTLVTLDGRAGDRVDLKPRGLGVAGTLVAAGPAGELVFVGANETLAMVPVAASASEPVAEDTIAAGLREVGAWRKRHAAPERSVLRQMRPRAGPVPATPRRCQTRLALRVPRVRGDCPELNAPIPGIAGAQAPAAREGRARAPPEARGGGRATPMGDRDLRGPARAVRGHWDAARAVSRQFVRHWKGSRRWPRGRTASSSRSSCSAGASTTRSGGSGGTSVESDLAGAPLALLRGRTTEAISAHEKALKAYAKLVGTRSCYLPDRAGLFFVVALIADGSPQSLCPRDRAHAARAAREACFLRPRPRLARRADRQSTRVSSGTSPRRGTSTTVVGLGSHFLVVAIGDAVDAPTKKPPGRR